jgi:hypothetical protein
MGIATGYQFLGIVSSRKRSKALTKSLDLENTFTAWNKPNYYYYY